MTEPRFPYELTRCPRLRASVVSTRALYGNFKYRPPFPALREPHVLPLLVNACSSACASLTGGLICPPGRRGARWRGRVLG